MKKTEIKIVGAIADENALEEIEEIAKLFAYEQRMKDYTTLLPIQHQPEKIKQNDVKKIGETNRFVTRTQSRIPVKGLC